LITDHCVHVSMHACILGLSFDKLYFWEMAHVVDVDVMLLRDALRSIT
jgi:hypothetical protein